MPPAVTRQRPTDRPKAQGNGRALEFAADSVLSKAIPASDIRDTFVKMLLYGPSGTGKTHLAGTFEKPLLHLSLEKTPSGGARTIRRFPGVTCLRPGAPTFDAPIVAADFVAEMEQLAAELAAKNPFRTVVIDHVTVFQDYVLEKIVGKPLPEQIGFGTVSGDHYRDRAEAVKQMLRPWVDMRCHTVFIGKEKDHNPPRQDKVNERTGRVQPDMRPRFVRGLQQESCVTVNLGGGAADWLMDACEYACRLYFDREVKAVRTVVNEQEVTDWQETGEFVRALRVTYHPNFYARFRSDAPEKMPEALVRPTWDRIKAVIEGTYKE